MLSLAVLSTLLLACARVNGAPTQSATPSSTASASEAFAKANADKVAKLRLAPSAADRMKLLEDDDLVFSFTNPPPFGVVTGAGGHTVEAVSDNFPAVIGNGVSMTVGFLGPCAINSPHTHPRATEINIAINQTLIGGILTENGAAFRQVEIPPGSATVFPQGAIHFEMNPSCDSAMFVAAFNGEDPGVQQVAQRFFGLPPDVVGATLGGLGVVEVAELATKIPDNVIMGVDECLARCGLERGNQPTAQQQPRVSANAFPDGVLASASATAYSAMSTASVSSEDKRAEWKREAYPQPMFLSSP